MLFLISFHQRSFFGMKEALLAILCFDKLFSLHSVLCILSSAPSPQGSVYRSQAEIAGGGGGGRSMRALVDHQPGGSNPTLLSFSRGEMITVLVQQAKKGWLYGRVDSTSE